MRHFGYLGTSEIFPDQDPDLVARVRLGTQDETDVEESILFYAIPKRRTNRQPFNDDLVPGSLLVNLQRAAAAEGAWLRFVHDQETRYAFADLVAEGDRMQWANKAFRLELSRWVHSNRSLSRDGVPGYAAGIDDLLSYTGPLVVRTFDMGEGQAARDHDVATGSPVLAVLGTDGDQRRDWVASGQALDRVLLRARVEGVWASFLNQPLEVPELRTKLKAVTGHAGFPQAVLRLGFGENVKPTPRREGTESYPEALSYFPDPTTCASARRRISNTSPEPRSRSPFPSSPASMARRPAAGPVSQNKSSRPAPTRWN